MRAVTDFQPDPCENVDLNGAVKSVPVNQYGPRSCPKTIFSAILEAKSLFRKIFHISPLNPKILREFLAESLIPIDKGEGGYPYQTGKHSAKPGAARRNKKQKPRTESRELRTDS